MSWLERAGVLVRPVRVVSRNSRCSQTTEFVPLLPILLGYHFQLPDNPSRRRIPMPLAVAEPCSDLAAARLFEFTGTLQVETLLSVVLY
jgi:hypothetical protein